MSSSERSAESSAPRNSLSYRVTGSPFSAMLTAFVAVLVFVPAVLYGNFVYDDHIHIVNNARLRMPNGWWEVLTTPAFPGSLYRPITYLSYWIEAQLFSIKAWHFLALNALLHGVNTALLYKLISNLRLPNVAFITALIFAVHPIHTEVVANGVGRAELLALFFGLSGLIAFTRQRPGFAMLFFLLSALSKESGLVFPLLAFVLTIARDDDRYAESMVLSLFTIGVVLALRYFAVGAVLSPHAFDVIDNPLSTLDVPTRAVNALILLERYISLNIFPFPLSADYSFATIIPVTLASLPYLQLTLAVVLLFGGALALMRGYLIGFGLVWFFTAFLLTCNLFFPIGTAFAERLAYAPSIGICLVIASLAVELRSFIAQALLVFIVTALFAGITQLYLPAWTSDKALVEYQMGVYPNSVKMLVNYSVVKRDYGELAEAERAAKRALELHPKSDEAMFSLGVIYLRTERVEEGKSLLLRALEIVPDHTEILNVLARQSLREEDFDMARGIIDRGLRAEPLNDKLLAAKYLLAVAVQDFSGAKKIEEKLKAVGSEDRDYLRVREQLRAILRGAAREEEKE
ncbi:MAG: tetratricopeptide repeat protein [Bdellovibrionales bacterium]|nr:tetratricopeptide repeat protein [Bdellovibrionales bacterium]